MAEGPLLHTYKYGRKTELHTDASKQGYGTILQQNAEEGKLYPAEEKNDSYELEKTMHKKDLITRISRWSLELEEFHYEIEHRVGSRMKQLEDLSRYPLMIICDDALTLKLKNAQKEDDNI
ncbi:transposon Ty3-I Gag-Pol polyprotein [Trichonephila clavipes]|nr:transposon Ty3-I Gag-Pol polyprotein [Trichonephila clavipes]